MTTSAIRSRRARWPKSPMMGILIHRSVEDVFDYGMELERTPTWRPRMHEVHWLTEGEPAMSLNSQTVSLSSQTRSEG